MTILRHNTALAYMKATRNAPYEPANAGCWGVFPYTDYNEKLYGLQ